MSRRPIVVAEDDATIAARLRSRGFQVEAAATGPADIAPARAVGPDLVVRAKNRPRRSAVLVGR